MRLLQPHRHSCVGPQGVMPSLGLDQATRGSGTSCYSNYSRAFVLGSTVFPSWTSAEVCAPCCTSCAPGAGLLVWREKLQPQGKEMAASSAPPHPDA